MCLYRESATDSKQNAHICAYTLIHAFHIKLPINILNFSSEEKII